MITISREGTKYYLASDSITGFIVSKKCEGQFANVAVWVSGSRTAYTDPYDEKTAVALIQEAVQALRNHSDFEFPEGKTDTDLEDDADEPYRFWL